MSFGSDNWAGASDKVMEALAEANAGGAPAYGADVWTARARTLLNDLFEREVAAFFVSTGTAANAIALASFSGPGAVTLCHTDAHIIRDEAGAPGLFAPTMVLDPLDGPGGRIEESDLTIRLADYPPGVVHHGRPSILSLSNVNEFGQCYDPAHIAALGEHAKGRGMALHIDGARFMNALAHGNRSAADLTWRAGVDVLSLGLTKTGGWCAEAVVYFDPARADEAMYRHKQAGQLMSKNRFAAAQFVALLSEDHALQLAARANRMASLLAAALGRSPHAQLLFAPQSNEIFAYVDPQAIRALQAAGVVAYPWSTRSKRLPQPPAPDWSLTRFVTSFRTTEAEVDRARDALATIPNDRAQSLRREPVTLN